MVSCTKNALHSTWFQAVYFSSFLGTYEHNVNFREIITIEPDKRGDKPCIRNFRITVYDVLDYLASCMSPQKILDEFDYLTMEHIQACLSYSADRER